MQLMQYLKVDFTQDSNKYRLAWEFQCHWW